MPEVFKFLSNFLFLYGIASIIVSIYKQNAYLYQASSVSVAYENWIEFFHPFAEKIPLKKYKKSIDPHLKRSAWRLDWTVDHFLALQLLCVAGAGVFAFLLFALFGLDPLFILLFMFISFIFPLLDLKSKANFRLKSINRDLPYFIDYLALVISAGMSFNGAIEKVLDNLKDSPIREEFMILFKSIRLGKTQTEALKDFSERMNHVNISQFVETMVQAIKQGSEVSVALQTISSSNSAKRFQIAEETAGKIAVKMIIPVILFVLPVIMVMLIVPIALDLFK